MLGTISGKTKHWLIKWNHYCTVILKIIQLLMFLSLMATVLMYLFNNSEQPSHSWVPQLSKSIGWMSGICKYFSQRKQLITFCLSRSNHHILKKYQLVSEFLSKTCSDKPGSHNFNFIKKLVLPDGSILRARYAGRPTRDCLFNNPVIDGKRWDSHSNIRQFLFEQFQERISILNVISVHNDSFAVFSRFGTWIRYQGLLVFSIAKDQESGHL